MNTSEEMEKLIAEWRLRPSSEKTKVFADFLQEYGEFAGWEEWVIFIQERPELEGFEWARSFFKKPSS